MNYQCPKCGNTNEPRVISHFPPKIYQCLNCGTRGSENDFTRKDKPKFSSLPPPPPPPH